MEHGLTLGLSDMSIIFGELIGYVGLSIMAIGVLKSMWLFVVRQIINRENILSAIRVELGQHLALGLEFLVGKDIIESLVHPTWDDLGKLAAIVALRTVLTLFLQRELKEISEDEAEEEELQSVLRRKQKLAERRKQSAA